MKIVKEIENKITELLANSGHQIFLRSDFEHLGTSQRLSQAIAAIQERGLLEKIGYGVYMTPNNDPVHIIVRNARSRLEGRSKRHLTISGRIFSLEKNAPH